MAEAWFIRVEGKEFGPADVETLREWKADGRVLPTNEARPAGVDLWITAAEIPGLFEPPPVQIASEEAPAPSPKRTFAQLVGDSFRIYGRGFFQYLFLTLLVALPSVCAHTLPRCLQRCHGAAQVLDRRCRGASYLWQTAGRDG